MQLVAHMLVMKLMMLIEIVIKKLKYELATSSTNRCVNFIPIVCIFEIQNKDSNEK